MWDQSSTVTEEQDTNQLPPSLTDSSEGPVSREALYEMVWSDHKPRRKHTVKRQLPDWHPLVGGAKPLFEAGRLSRHGYSGKSFNS